MFWQSNVDADATIPIAIAISGKCTTTVLELRQYYPEISTLRKTVVHYLEVETQLCRPFLHDHDF